MAVQILKPSYNILVTGATAYVNSIATPPVWARLNDNPFPIAGGGAFGNSDFVGVNLPMTNDIVVGLSPAHEPFARSDYPDGSSYESGHVVRISISTDIVIYLQYQLREGSTVIATTGTLSPATGTRPTPSTYEMVLTPAEARKIKSYASLSVALVDPGGNSLFFADPMAPVYAQFPYTIESIEMEIPREARRRTSEAVYL